MENQNPHQDPIVPDYGFITDQQAPEPARKTHAKKVYVLFGLLVLLMLAGGLSLLFGASSNNVATNQTTQTEAEITVQTYLQRIEKGSDTEAYQMIAADHRISQEFFVNGTATLLRNRYTLSECTYTNDKDSGPSVFVVLATCPVKDSKDKYTFEFRVIATDTPQIVAMKAVEKS